MSSAGPENFLDERKSLACVHCGLCLSACPTYLETGNENDSPRGRIYLMRAIQAGRSALTDTAVRHVDLCLGCRACEVACPSGVPYGELLEATRAHVERRYSRSLFQRLLRRLAIEGVFPFPARLKLVLLPAKLMRTIGGEGLLPRFLRDAFALIPSEGREGDWPEFSPATAATKRGRAGFIRGCVMNVLFGATNEATIELLNRAGFDVVTPREQGCCGALYAHSGNLEAARNCARRNIEAFEALELDTIVINAAGCGSTLKEYGHLLGNDPAWAQRAAAFSAKVKDITEVLRPFEVQNSKFKVVTYHDACHLAHAQRITRQPRELVKAVAGRNFVELPESDVCCGSAGSYNLTEPEMAGRLQRRKTENILKTSADVVVTTNPGCLLQLRAGLDKAGAKHVRVMHIADFLRSAQADTCT